MRSPGQGATASAGDASGRVKDRNETRRLQMPPQCWRRHTDSRRRATHTTLGSLLGRLVLNGINTDGLLVPECRALSASAVHVDLGVCSRGSGTHRDSKRTFPTHGARKYKKGAGEMARVP